MIEHQRRLNRRATPPPPLESTAASRRAARVRHWARPTPAAPPPALPPLVLPPRPWRPYFLAKRCIDVIATLIGLVLLSPLLGLVALLIKLEDGGPVFFKQTRVGEDGRHFPIYKFRSMRPDAEAQRAALLEVWKAGKSGGDTVRFKLTDDPRITRVGRWLRRFSIDEMPQLWNVVVGDMTLVGPRPPLPEEVALYGPRERLRLAAPQGLTCLWQVRGRSLIPFDRQVEMDVEYMERRSTLFDLLLLLRTVPAVVGGRGAH
jgi:lipopolysaccharide/colanic/teichoic acid biosynthesis glycosyltransferase